MGADLIIVVFAVVVIGGMGSILGSIVTGFGLGLDRGPDQGVLPRGLEHRDLRHHGDRAAGQAGRACSGGRSSDGRRADVASPRPGAAPARRGTSAALFAVMVGALRWSAPFVVYPVFLMKALCFALFACAFNLLLGYGGLLSFGHATFLGIGGLRRRATPPRSGACRRSSAILAGTRGAARCSALVVGAARDPPPGHLLRDDHAGARADDLLLLPAGAVHRRRGRHPGGAARHAVRRDRPRATT